MKSFFTRAHFIDSFKVKYTLIYFATAESESEARIGATHNYNKTVSKMVLEDTSSPKKYELIRIDIIPDTPKPESDPPKENDWESIWDDNAS